MSTVIAKLEIRDEQDVVYARQRVRLVAGLLGFDTTGQTRLSTAVSEIARNAHQYAAGGQVELLVEGKAPPQVFCVTVRDSGPGIANLDAILAGRYRSRTGMGLGIVGAGRLMDHFHVETAPGRGTTVFLGKTIPSTAEPVTPAVVRRIAEALLRSRVDSPLEEIRLQNQELLRAMDELRQRQDELVRLNRELEDTNRGVLALYAEVDEKAAQLARANELKTQFLSNMSHEFRTPLNSIIALSRLLLDRTDGELTEEQEKQVRFIRRSAEDLSALVNDLLDLAKIEAGKTVVRPRHCTVSEIFSGLRGMLKPMLVNSGLNLVFEDADDLPGLYTDDGKVSQILRNLLSNALKFTERGEIRVRASEVGDGRAVLFAVSDTGVGIAPEDQSRIFDEYVQVEGADRGRARGTGLGLAISRKLAQMLGGSLDVVSQLGVGSTFSLVIPLNFEEPAAVAPQVEVEADLTRHQVLVVEDDPATQALYEKFLKTSGFQVLAASSIRAATQILERAKPLAIILDILMPLEDSWRFLADLKSAEATRSIPVIIASVVNEQDRALTLGAEDYCVKPLERKWLLARLKELARRSPVEKVLIIDDEEVARYILKGNMADTKYSILEARDGPAGLALAREARPDIIFLDLVMPGMSGFEVLHRLKADEATRDIPVVIITSKLLDEDERRALSSEALAILSKEAPSRDAALAAIGRTLRQAAENIKARKQPHGR
ncbi:MAG: ATP-binding protein [Vicinamibacterales bacterium]